MDSASDNFAIISAYYDICSIKPHADMPICRASMAFPKGHNGPKPSAPTAIGSGEATRAIEPNINTRAVVQIF